MTGLPPSAGGAVHDTVAWALPAVALPMVGADGVVAAGRGSEAFSAEPQFRARDPSSSCSVRPPRDQVGVCAAALESLAESFNDGVVAPLFWFLVGGLAGLFAYKAVNTADSLIGHREEPYRCFGWAAARTDDLMNLVPARIAGALIALVAGRGWRVMLRDARKHASPNSGWPEAAMAGALQVRLGGPASYDGVPHARPTFGEGPRPSPLDLRRGLGLYLRACAVLAAALALGGLAWPR